MPRIALRQRLYSRVRGSAILASVLLASPAVAWFPHGTGASACAGDSYSSSDGCAGAVAAQTSLPSLLTSQPHTYYATPPWYLAGVNYAVGLPVGDTLFDPITYCTNCTISGTTLTVPTSSSMYVGTNTSVLNATTVSFSAANGYGGPQFTITNPSSTITLGAAAPVKFTFTGTTNLVSGQTYYLNNPINCNASSTTCQFNVSTSQHGGATPLTVTGSPSITNIEIDPPVGQWQVGESVYAACSPSCPSGVTLGEFLGTITALGTGTGGAGTYTLSQNDGTVTSARMSIIPGGCYPSTWSDNTATESSQTYYMAGIRVTCNSGPSNITIGTPNGDNPSAKTGYDFGLHGGMRFGPGSLGGTITVKNSHWEDGAGDQDNGLGSWIYGPSAAALILINNQMDGNAQNLLSLADSTGNDFNTVGLCNLATVQCGTAFINWTSTATTASGYSGQAFVALYNVMNNASARFAEPNVTGGVYVEYNLFHNAFGITAHGEWTFPNSDGETYIPLTYDYNTYVQDASIEITPAVYGFQVMTVASGAYFGATDNSYNAYVGNHPSNAFNFYMSNNTAPSAGGTVTFTPPSGSGLSASTMTYVSSCTGGTQAGCTGNNVLVGSTAIATLQNFTQWCNSTTDATFSQFHCLYVGNLLPSSADEYTVAVYGATTHGWTFSQSGASADFSIAAASDTTVFAAVQFDSTITMENNYIDPSGISLVLNTTSGVTISGNVNMLCGSASAPAGCTGTGHTDPNINSTSSPVGAPSTGGSISP